MRAACVDGLRVTLRLDQPLKSASRVQFAYENPDDEGIDLIITDMNLENKVTDVPNSRRVSWEELQAMHATKAADTTIARETIEVPAGTYDCVRYTVQTSSKKGEIVDTLWFAFELPGPFIKRVTTRDGEGVMEMVLVDRVVMGSDK